MMETAVNGDGQSPESDTRSREDLLSEVSRLERQVGELTLAGHQFVSTQMQSLLHNSSDAIIQFNPDGTIATFNTTAERIFGHSEIELMYQPADDLFVCPEEFIENIPAWLAHYSSTVENQYDQPRLNGYESLVEKHGLKMQFDSPDFDTHGCFDPDRIAVVLRNFLSNAIKFTPPGKTISVLISHDNLQYPDSGQLHDALRLTVRDQGKGIPEDKLNLVFEAYTQSRTNQKSAGGTGLGLAISQEILHYHKGKFFAEINADEGADFIFVIPRECLADTELDSTSV